MYKKQKKQKPRPKDIKFCEDCGQYHNLSKNKCYKKKLRNNSDSQVYRAFSMKLGGFNKQFQRSDDIHFQYTKDMINTMINDLEHAKEVVTKKLKGFSSDKKLTEIDILERRREFFGLQPFIRKCCERRRFTISDKLFRFYPNFDNDWNQFEKGTKTIFFMNQSQFPFTVTWDQVKNFLALGYPNLVMYDFDEKDFESKDKCRKCIYRMFQKYFPHSTFLVVKTDRGYHVYNVTEESPHDHIVTIAKMCATGCDQLYIMKSFWRGFQMRLLPKFDGDFVMRFDSDDWPMQRIEFEGVKLTFPVWDLTKVGKQNCLIGPKKWINMKLLRKVCFRAALIDFCRQKLPHPYPGTYLNKAINLHMEKKMNDTSKISILRNSFQCLYRKIVIEKKSYSKIKKLKATPQSNMMHLYVGMYVAILFSQFLCFKLYYQL